MRAWVAALALLTLTGIGCSAPDESRVVVAAAVSIAPAMREIAGRFEAELTTGGSGLLVQQILRGAPVDLFVSASPAEIDRLERAGLIVEGTRRTIASNGLLVAVRRGRRSLPSSLADLGGEGFDRIAVANPRTAPLGRYAEQALRAAGVIERVGKRLVFAENARYTLDYVARGEADAAIVYRSDAGLAGVDVALTVDERLHDPILYHAAVVKGGAAPERAAAMLAFLRSREGGELLRAHGLEPAP